MLKDGAGGRRSDPQGTASEWVTALMGQLAVARAVRRWTWLGKAGHQRRGNRDGEMSSLVSSCLALPLAAVGDELSSAAGSARVILPLHPWSQVTVGLKFPKLPSIIKIQSK